MDNGNHDGGNSGKSDDIYNSDNDFSLEATIRDVASGRPINNRAPPKPDDASPLTNDNNSQEAAVPLSPSDTPESISSSSSTGATPTSRSARVRASIPPELNSDISKLGTGQHTLSIHTPFQSFHEVPSQSTLTTPPPPLPLCSPFFTQQVYPLMYEKHCVIVFVRNDR